mgnify:FL=1
MAVSLARESYFEAGVEALAELGYSGLKLAEVCWRLGVTTGSFYHHFPNWGTYTKEFIEHWVHARSTAITDAVARQSSPRKRLETLITRALDLPHSAEAAILVWSALDPDVYAAQCTVDQLRFDILAQSAQDITGDRQQAEVFASCLVYVLIGYEQTTVAHNSTNLRWIADQLVADLDPNPFTTVPGD